MDIDMKNTISLFLILPLLTFYSCRGSSSSNFDGSSKNHEPTEEELKAKLEDKECLNSNTYISGTMAYDPIYKNALSIKVKGVKLKFEFTNAATLATYKDLVCKVDFYSKTDKLLFSKTIIIYDYLTPGGTLKYKTEFEISNQDYKDIHSFSWSITDVSCH